MPRALFDEQEGNINSHEQDADDNGCVKQPFFESTPGLHNISASAENIGKSGRFVLQSHNYYQQNNDQNIGKLQKLMHMMNLKKIKLTALLYKGNGSRVNCLRGPI